MSRLAGLPNSAPRISADSGSLIFRLLEEGVDGVEMAARRSAKVEYSCDNC
jgi:hypothetical protein